MEARVKSGGLIRNSEIAIEILDLTTQSGEVVHHSRGIAGVVVRAKVAIESCFDECRFRGAWTFCRRFQQSGRLFGEIDANPRLHEEDSRSMDEGPLFWMPASRVRPGIFWIDVTKRRFPTTEPPQSAARVCISLPPATALDGAQEGFDLGIECRGFFEIDRVPGFGANPEPRVGKCGPQHQIGIEAARVLITDSQQNWSRDFSRLIAQVIH
jgi:hypothetical protein